MMRVERGLMHVVAVATLLVVAGATLVASPARGWNALGHEMVARVAWLEMTPEARKRALELLHSAPTGSQLPGLYPTFNLPKEDLDRIFFERAATWPDVARDLEEYHRGPWHYINRFWEQVGEDRVPRARDDLPGSEPNIVSKLFELERALAEGTRESSQLGIDLAWVLHLGGDIHQPLHNTSRVSEHPDDARGDRGGNNFKVLGAPFENLHSYWDNILEIHNPRTPEENFGQYTRRIQAELEERHPKSSFLRAELWDGDYDRWSVSAAKLTQRLVYPADLVRGEEPSAAYRERAYTVALGRMALAGYRLGKLLNAVLAP